jgi:hypothetical protein
MHVKLVLASCATQLAVWEGSTRLHASTRSFKPAHVFLPATLLLLQGTATA